LHFGHNFISFCSLAALTKRKPARLLCKRFPEVKIELRRGNHGCFPRTCPKNGALPSRNQCTQPKTNRTRVTIPTIKPTTITEP
jgi:hypothetical protein